MANTYKTASPTDSGSLNYHIQDVALAMGLGRLNSDLVVTKLITNYSDEASNQGSKFGATVRVPLRGNVSAGNKTPGSAVTPSPATSTQGVITVNKHKTFDVLVEDYGSLFAQQGLLTGYLEDGASSIAEAIETDVIAEYANASRLIGAPGGNASATLVRTIRGYTHTDKWRQGRPAYIVWGGEGEKDLLGDALFVQADQSGTDEAVTNAKIGTKLGFTHYVSNLMPVIAGSPGAEHALAFQSEGIGVAFVPMTDSDLPAELQNASVVKSAMYYNDDAGNPAYSLRLIVGYDQKERGYLLTVDTIYGVGTIRPALVYDILL